jgi:DNA-binding NtrC family response regulator
LYYRLNVFPIHLPTLRERAIDIPVLANFILGKITKKMNLSDKSFDERSVEAMIGYSWPGNVRELENVIERAVILSDGADVDMVEMLSASGGSLAGGVLPGLSHQASEPTGSAGDHIVAGERQNMKEAVKTLEMNLISSALQTTRGNQIQAAKSLGISREGLRKKLARYEMSGQQYTNPA